MTIRFLYCAALSTLLSACAGSPAGLPVMHLTADMEVSDTADPGNIMTARIALHPAVTDSTLIDYMLVAGIVDGYTYVSSDRNMVFDSEGRCVSSFSHVGQGPEEYGKWDRAVADPSTGDWLIVASGSFPEVKRYTRSGRYIRTDTLISVSNLNPTGNGWIATNNEFKNPVITLYYYDRDLNLTDSLPTRFRHRVYADGNSGFSGLPCLMGSNGEKAYIVRHDTVFDITEPKSDPRPVAITDFSEMTLPPDVDIHEVRDWYTKYIEPRYTFGSNCLMVTYTHDFRSAIRVYSMTDGRLLLALTAPANSRTNGVPIDCEGVKYYVRDPTYTHENTFYFGISDSQMSEITGDEESNPALMTVGIRPEAL